MEEPDRVRAGTNAPIFSRLLHADSVRSGDGSYLYAVGFSPNIARYLCELGQARPSVVLAFPPKAAGTYLRSAAISAVGGQLVRTVQAQGGRDATFYLPTFILYYTRGIPHPRPHAGAGCEPGVFLRQHWT